MNGRFPSPHPPAGGPAEEMQVRERYGGTSPQLALLLLRGSRVGADWGTPRAFTALQVGSLKGTLLTCPQQLCWPAHCMPISICNLQRLQGTGPFWSWASRGSEWRCDLPKLTQPGTRIGTEAFTPTRCDRDSWTRSSKGVFRMDRAEREGGSLHAVPASGPGHF